MIKYESIQQKEGSHDGSLWLYVRRWHTPTKGAWQGCRTAGDLPSSSLSLLGITHRHAVKDVDCLLPVLSIEPGHRDAWTWIATTSGWRNEDKVAPGEAPFHWCISSEWNDALLWTSARCRCQEGTSMARHSRSAPFNELHFKERQTIKVHFI